ncbi:TnpV protein [[Clostridium] innocuum]|uniref:TnpV protein n=1 Tax=Clostridium innocuum TaxID=1522 RepID=A0AAP9SEF7_CLOIN|nr:TnpV protein [[Clostridium] innocuum]OUO24685.1 TnpV protein [Eubacterium sp. An3]MBS9795709.1 TnpV protein [[Clostridium] innocuum]MBU9116788.1 TnpV protein [[Clostridium] innocuum]MBV4070926.1 TnpV protein [[Clostridium] innocuum]MCC2838939.1 TnpV protein [[Clostridium] innocuum]
MERRAEIICIKEVNAAGVTEELKARDLMRWVGLINTLKAQVEDIIQAELIFK